MTDPTRQFLRHAVATLAYRGSKVVRNAPAHFASWQVGETTRTPAQILAHVGDLLEWALSQAMGRERWHDTPPLPWDQEVARFHAALDAFDAYLASEAALARPCEQLFQGPIADALTHVGQLAMLRRLAGEPVRGENYAVADIATGRVGPQQAVGRLEFDREGHTGAIILPH